MLNNFPSNLHPMAQFSAAITALNSESKFAKGYSEGVHKGKYWEVCHVISRLGTFIWLSEKANKSIVLLDSEQWWERTRAKVGPFVGLMGDMVA